jgi:membrane protease YdiL (CAAX protease family)
MIPRILGLPNGKQLLNQYLVSVKVNWLKPLLKILGWVSLGILLFYGISTTTTNLIYQIHEFLIYFDFELLSFIMNSSILFWQELLFRGIILTMLLKKRKNLAAILINAGLYVVFLLITQISLMLFDPYIPIEIIINSLIMPLILVFFNQMVLAFLFIKTQNILPGIILQILTMYIYFPGTLPFYL